jgi:hypothetical protein
MARPHETSLSSSYLPVAFRALIARSNRGHSKLARRAKHEPPCWPRRVLFFDTETTTDPTQTLNFGSYRKCRMIGAKYVCVEEGFFYADELPCQRRFNSDPPLRGIAEVKLTHYCAL